jgi:hypothetical protein
MPLTTGILSTSTDISRRTERSRGSRITAGLRAFAGRRSARLRWVCVEEGRFPAISLALLARRFGRDIALRSSAALSAVDLPGVVWPFRNVQRARARGDDRRTTRLADLAPTADRYRPNSVPGEPDGASNRSGLAAAIRDDRYRESRGTRAGSTSRAISRGICGVRATAAGGEQSDAKGHGEYRCFAAHADWTHRHNRRFSPRAVNPNGSSTGLGRTAQNAGSRVRERHLQAVPRRLRWLDPRGQVSADQIDASHGMFVPVAAGQRSNALVQRAETSIVDVCGRL